MIGPKKTGLQNESVKLIQNFNFFSFWGSFLYWMEIKDLQV